MKKSSPILHTFLLGLSLLLSAQLVHAKEIKQTFNGLTLNANLVMADGKSFQDGMVLLTHGTLTHSGRSTYSAIQKFLAERGISSIAPNLSLGVNDRHGEYDCSVPHRHLHEDALDEIGFWVDWLKKQGTDSLTLMGHSRGGNQTAWFSVERDEPVIKDVILIAPQTWSYQSEKAEYQKKYNQSIDPIFAKAEKLVKAGKGETLIKDINFIYCKHTDATANAIVSYYKNEPKMDTPTLLKKAIKPTLVIIGTEDKVVSDLSEKMAAVKNPQVHVAVIDGANHHFRDFFAEDLADQATDFIQAHQ